MTTSSRLAIRILTLTLAVGLTACSGGGGGGSARTNPNAASTTAAAATPGTGTTATPAMPAAPATNLAWNHPSVAAKAPSASSGSTSGTGTTTGSTSGTTGLGSTGSGSTTGSTSGSAPAPVAAPIPAPTAAAIYGTVPPDPETGFNGLLFFQGERFQPGSTLLVTYQGLPLKVLPLNFDSSQLVSAYVFLTIAGDYEFTVVAPDLTQSPAYPLTIPQGPPPALTNPNDPELHMIFPPTITAGYTGNIWLMGDHFVPGSTLVLHAQGTPAITLPLNFVNSRNLGWITSLPLAGDVTIRVLSPDLRTSNTLQLTIDPNPVTTTGQFPAPIIAFGPSLVEAPFLGTVRLVGQDYLPGAVLEIKDTVRGTVTTSLLTFQSSSEVTWMAPYPQPGDYELTVINPDGQRSAPWSFMVQ